MIESITLLDIETARSITIDKDDSVFVLESVDWDEPDVDFSTYRVPYQKGHSVSGLTVGDRKPTIYGYVIADSKNIAKYPRTYYFQEQLKQIEENKEKLNSWFSIYKDCMLVVGDYSMKCRLASPPKYGTSESENNEVMCKFQLSFTSFETVFKSSEKSVLFYSASSDLSFPIKSLDTKKEIVFGDREANNNLLIENDGDTEVGFEATMVVNSGSVTNPVIYNLATGDLIKFENLVLNEGDSISLNTNVGEENAIANIDGVEFNAIGYITSESTFFKLIRGGQTISYSADIGGSLLDVSISYSNEFFNVKEM